MKNRIVFDVGHPGQVHQFKHVYWELEKIGWECIFVAKDKDITIDLLKEYKLDYFRLSESRKGLLNKIIQVPRNDWNFYLIVKNFKPDFILNRFSIHSGHISKLLKIINIGFSDTEHAVKLHKLTIPFVDIKFTGKTYYNNLGKNHIKYDSNIELFYLHPDIFKPSIDPYALLEIPANSKYCLIRFVSWKAHHDVGIRHMSWDEKIRLVEIMKSQYKVFISSEGPLPKELHDHKIQINPIHIHSILKEASFYIGEGGTMASEAACLNTPVIYINPLPIMGYLKEQSDFGLLFQTTNLNEIQKLIISGFSDKTRNHSKYISQKINPVKFIVWFIENYPDSLRIIKENPDYQDRFR
ncbi:MAG: DUF354 domain-containing protein [Candidatus Atribacteria bacterium]|nr:DUF354 domain-containing protein [Candidatus Atribacteria bacterium]